MGNLHCTEDISLGRRGIQPRTSAPEPDIAGEIRGCCEQCY